MLNPASADICKHVFLYMFFDPGPVLLHPYRNCIQSGGRDKSISLIWTPLQPKNMFIVGPGTSYILG